MAMWTKAKLEEAIDSKSIVLKGANPFIATNFLIYENKNVGVCPTNFFEIFL